MVDKKAVEAKPAGHEETFDSIHEQIGREESLVNNRLTWLLVFHGLLFNVIAQNAGQPLDQRLVDVLLKGIPAVGVFTALLGFVGVWAAYSSISGIQAVYEQLPEEERTRRARPFGGKWTHRFGMAPSVGIPAVLTVAWGWIWWAL
jgi:hypothetical protein